MKINETESSFNNLTDNILNSPLSKTRAFIETLSKIIPDEYNNKINTLKRIKLDIKTVKYSFSSLFLIISSHKLCHTVKQVNEKNAELCICCVQLARVR